MLSNTTIGLLHYRKPKALRFILTCCCWFQWSTLMSSVTGRAKVFLVKWWHVSTWDCICAWYLKTHKQTVRSWKDCTEGCVKCPGSLTMSASARQSPSKWNTTVAPKMASSIVFTGINGHILLCTNTWKRQKDTFRDLNNFREGDKTNETFHLKIILQVELILSLTTR